MIPFGMQSNLLASMQQSLKITYYFCHVCLSTAACNNWIITQQIFMKSDIGKIY